MLTRSICRKSDHKGTGALRGTDRKNGKARTAKPDKPSTTRANMRDKNRHGHVGSSLRSVYEQTVNEEIPSEFLDLLGKLS
jgi:hypothetical protein